MENWFFYHKIKPSDLKHTVQTSVECLKLMSKDNEIIKWYKNVVVSRCLWHVGYRHQPMRWQYLPTFFLSSRLLALRRYPKSSMNDKFTKHNKNSSQNSNLCYFSQCPKPPSGWKIAKISRLNVWQLFWLTQSCISFLFSSFYYNLLFCLHSVPF